MIPPQEEDSGPAAEFFACLVLCAGLTALLYALWTLGLPAALEGRGKVVRILPRLSVFLLGLAGAVLIQGARPNRRALLCGGLAALAASAGLLQFAGVMNDPLAAMLPQAAGRMESFSTFNPFNGTAYQTTAAVIPLLRLECAFFAALLLGTWLGADLKDPSDFLTLVLCAAAGDYWLNTFKVTETSDPDSIIALLRLPWPTTVGRLSGAPAFTDILFTAALLRGAANLHISRHAVLTGAAAGYCCACFLMLSPWPGWPASSMLLCGSGILIASWHEARCGLADLGRALLVSAVLLVVLLEFGALHRRLQPAPEPQGQPAHYNRTT